MRIRILTGGGDAPGLNATIRAVGQLTFRRGGTAIQVCDGWRGLLGDGDMIELDESALANTLSLGGIILGSSRTNPMKRAVSSSACAPSIGPPSTPSSPSVAMTP